MLLGVGDLFAGYRILRVLGSGGMGEVYLVQHPRLPRRDALKLLRTDISADADYRSRFEREADLASTLWHPNIVGLHDRGEVDGHLWITMDFVDGLNAAELMSERYSRCMPPELVIKIVSAVASALDYAHKQGLLHRDVKPANIMMSDPDDDGGHRIVLADFGIARNIDDISGLTATNMTVGTVAYAAPEQLMGEPVDGRADQYALAATACSQAVSSIHIPTRRWSSAGTSTPNRRSLATFVKTWPDSTHHWVSRYPRTLTPDLHEVLILHARLKTRTLPRPLPSRPRRQRSWHPYHHEPPLQEPTSNSPERQGLRFTDAQYWSSERVL